MCIKYKWYTYITVVDVLGIAHVLKNLSPFLEPTKYGYDRSFRVTTDSFGRRSTTSASEIAEIYTHLGRTENPI